MMDLRTWGQGLRTEGLDWTGLEGLGLEDCPGPAAGCGQAGLALSGDLIRGGPLGRLWEVQGVLEESSDRLLGRVVHEGFLRAIWDDFGLILKGFGLNF